MGGPVLDVQVGDLAIVDLLDNDEVIRLVGSTVGALAIPVSLAVSVNDVALSSSDGDGVTRDDHGVKVRVRRGTERGSASESDGGACLKSRKVDGGRDRSRNA